jgi:hypothetical protein
MPSTQDASLPDASVPNFGGVAHGRIDAPSVPDFGGVARDCGIADAGLADGAYGTPGWTCTVPAQAHSVGTCQVVLNQGWAPLCRPTEYGLSCSEELDASLSEELDASLGCRLDFFTEQAPTREVVYCCSCEGTDAATGCVNVDLSTYDRSCNKDSDCVEITSGMMCPGGCSCGGSAINVDGLCRYDQTVAPLASSGGVCNCPADFGACCRAGRCVDDFCCLNACPDAGSGD